MEAICVFCEWVRWGDKNGDLQLDLQSLSFQVTHLHCTLMLILIVNWLWCVSYGVLFILFPDYQLLQKLHFISAHHQYMHWPSRRPAICPHCHKFFKFKYNMKIHMKKCAAAQGHSGPEELAGHQHPSSLQPPPPPTHAQVHSHGTHSASWLEEVRRDIESNPYQKYHPTIAHPRSVETVNGGPLPSLIPVSSPLTPPLVTSSPPPLTSLRCSSNPSALHDLQESAGLASRRLATAGERKWFPGWIISVHCNIWILKSKFILNFDFFF